VRIALRVIVFVGVLFGVLAHSRFCVGQGKQLRITNFLCEFVGGKRACSSWFPVDIGWCSGD